MRSQLRVLAAAFAPGTALGMFFRPVVTFLTQIFTILRPPARRLIPSDLEAPEGRRRSWRPRRRWRASTFGAYTTSTCTSENKINQIRLGCSLLHIM